MSLIQRINQIVSSTDPSALNQIFQGCQDYLDKLDIYLDTKIANRLAAIDEQLIPAILILTQNERLNFSNPRELGFVFVDWLVKLHQTDSGLDDLELQAAWLWSAIENFERDHQEFFNA